MGKLFDETTEEAFADPFYDEDVVVEMKRGEKTTVKACVMTDNTLDPMSDEMLDTEQKGINLTFRREDFPYIGNIKRGDRITRTILNGQQKSYTVSEVKDDMAFGFVVSAKEVS